MQRRFSTFADGWLARAFDAALAGGRTLLFCVVATPVSVVAAPHVIGALAGLLLIAGLWTPFAGAVAACAEVWVVFSSPAHATIPVILAILAVTLGLIGPAGGPSMPGFTAGRISSSRALALLGRPPVPA